VSDVFSTRQAFLRRRCDSALSSADTRRVNVHSRASAARRNPARPPQHVDPNDLLCLSLRSGGSGRPRFMVVFAAAVAVIRAAVEHAPSGRLDRDHHLALCGP